METHFDFRSADPSDSRQSFLQEHMIGLVVEAPLTDGQRSSGVLDLVDHLGELFSLVIPQRLVVLDRGDIELVLGFWLGRLERTGQDGQFDVFQTLK